MVNLEKARKEVQKAEALLIGRFGDQAQVLAHLTRAVQHLIPDEPEAASQVHPEQPVSTEPETVTTVADTGTDVADATPEPESGTEGPAEKRPARRKARRTKK